MTGKDKHRLAYRMYYTAALNALITSTRGFATNHPEQAQEIAEKGLTLEIAQFGEFETDLQDTLSEQFGGSMQGILSEMEKEMAEIRKDLDD